VDKVQLVDVAAVVAKTIRKMPLSPFQQRQQRVGNSAVGVAIASMGKW